MSIAEPAPHAERDRCPIVAGPQDTLLRLRTVHRPTRTDPDQQVVLYVAIHRTHGAWTHVYAVHQSPRRPGHSVQLLRVWPGESLPDARRWVENQAML